MSLPTAGRRTGFAVTCAAMVWWVVPALGEGMSAEGIAAGLVLVGSIAVAGLVIGEWRPGHRLGITLQVLAGLQVVVMVATSWREWAATGADLPLTHAAMVLEFWTWPLPALGLPLVLLWFPTGSAPAGWRWVGVVPAVGLSGFVVSRFIPVDLADGQDLPALRNPTGIPGAEGLEVAVALVPLAIAVGLVAATAAAVVRHRRADAEERSRQRWFFGATLVAGALVLAGVGAEAVGVTAVGDAAALLVPPLVAAGLVLSTMRDIAGHEVATATGAERGRLQRDLHDGIGSSLTGIRMQLSALALKSPELRTELVDLAADVELAQTELRRLVDGLAPAALVGQGLAEALEELVAPLRGSGIEVQVETDPEALAGMEPLQEVIVYRIAAEALTNVAKHARARTCVVRLRVAEDGVRLAIEDDGLGLHEEAAGGVGLGSMTARARAVGGDLLVVPGDGGGTVVTALLPWQPK